jgi:hypothetical protein
LCELLGSKSLHTTLVDSQHIRPTRVTKFRENSILRTSPGTLLPDKLDGDGWGFEMRAKQR